MAFRHRDRQPAKHQQCGSHICLLHTFRIGGQGENADELFSRTVHDLLIRVHVRGTSPYLFQAGSLCLFKMFNHTSVLAHTLN